MQADQFSNGGGRNLFSSQVLTSSCLPVQIEHLYGLTVFENYLYATNPDNANAQQKTSVIQNRFNSTDYQVVTLWTRVPSTSTTSVVSPGSERRAAAPSGTLPVGPPLVS